MLHVPGIANIGLWNSALFNSAHRSWHSWPFLLYATAPFLLRSDLHSYQLYNTHRFLLASFLIYLPLPHTHAAFTLPLLPPPFQILPEKACEPHVYPAPDVGANLFFGSLTRPAIGICTSMYMVPWHISCFPSSRFRPLVPSAEARGRWVPPCICSNHNPNTAVHTHLAITKFLHCNIFIDSDGINFTGFKPSGY